MADPSCRRVRAELDCGTALYFEDLTLAPGVGDRVPCARHGYCTVDAVARAPRSPVLAYASRRRSPRRTQAELLAHLQDADEFTLHQLRRERFSLRMVMSAQAEGLLRVDDSDERVVVRRSAGWDRQRCQPPRDVTLNAPESTEGVA